MPAPEIAGRAIGSLSPAGSMGCLALFTSRRSPTAGHLDIQVFQTLYGTLRMQSRVPASEDVPEGVPPPIGATVPPLGDLFARALLAGA